MTLLSPLAAAVAEMQANGAVAALTTRIRELEPAGAVGSDPGDVRPPGSYVRYVVAFYMDAPEDPSLPTVSASIGLRVYGLTMPDAEATWNAVAAVFRRKGPRVTTERLGIYASSVTGMSGTDLDPSNQQPYCFGVVELIATSVAVPT